MTDLDTILADLTTALNEEKAINAAIEEAQHTRFAARIRIGHEARLQMARLFGNLDAAEKRVAALKKNLCNALTLNTK